ncbi:MAG: multidrug effflux MFS transporter [Hyphomicrobiales bacterium]|nr:multidrug effflux MFS transporter [Hyphomicrobiales bacterium]MCP5374118.1 multidrug effflux MFS transporter [Hyphomicrobiales bacterium]
MLRPAATPPRLLTLILLSGLAVVSLNMFVPSLAHIAADFGADYSLVNLSIAGYAAVTAVLQLIMGPLSDRFGRRPIILAAVFIFALASLGCVLATDVHTFLFFRMMQAAIVTGHAVSQAVIRDSAGAQKAASLLGYMAMAWAVAPMLGPLFGGVLDEFFGWRANFWAFLAFGLAAFALAWTDLGETNQHRSETFTKQFQTYPELFRSRRYWGYALCTAFSVGTFYAFLGGAPLTAVLLFGLSPATLGMFMGTITAGFMVGSYLSGRFAGRHAPTAMMVVGRAVGTLGLLAGLALSLAGVVHVAVLFGFCVFAGLGNGLTVPSSNAGLMSVRPRLAGSASGLSGALTVALGAVTSAITGAIVTADNATYALLAMMSLSSALGLGAAVVTHRLERAADPA